jgi:hypothetical protein
VQSHQARSSPVVWAAPNREVRLEDQSEIVVQSSQAHSSPAVWAAPNREVRGLIVITIVIDRNLEEVSSCLAAQKLGAPIVADTTWCDQSCVPSSPQTEATRSRGRNCRYRQYTSRDHWSGPADRQTECHQLRRPPAGQGCSCSWLAGLQCSTRRPCM